MWWNGFHTFLVIVVVAGVLYELLNNIWRLHAQRPKCRCSHTLKEKS